MERMVCGIILTPLLLVGILTLVFRIQPVQASGAVYIRADGSIDPPTANITTFDNITYTLTGNIYDQIVVEKDDVVIDGQDHMVQGTGLHESKGIFLTGRSKVTIKNMEIRAFHFGIYFFLSGTSNNTISGNNIVDNYEAGIILYGSSNNIISGNNITNSLYGVWPWHSSSNIISGNNITANSVCGIYLQMSSDNTISGNNIAANKAEGILLDSSSNNEVYHNNFKGNTRQVTEGLSHANFWDDGYPSGGNFWSDYAGVDLHGGVFQNETGSDGVGDTPYSMDGDNRDNYPLVKAYAGPIDIGITDLAFAKTVVMQGFNTSMSVRLLNYGAYPESFNVTLYANTTTLARSEASLTSRASTTLVVAWNASGFAKGNYTVWAYAEPLQGEMDLIDNNVTGGYVIVSMAGDLTGFDIWAFIPDGVVDGSDVGVVNRCFGSWPGAPPPLRWHNNCDINIDGVIDGSDVIIINRHFGESDP